MGSILAEHTKTRDTRPTDSEDALPPFPEKAEYQAYFSLPGEAWTLHHKSIQVSGAGLYLPDPLDAKIYN